ncbi:MAG: hypothetical protein JNL11_03995 [Bdellovibrionaceae bacterium]|nr:hypothetical protein [Pseudobdellovibrionaceae bacterium]
MIKEKAKTPLLPAPSLLCIIFCITFFIGQLVLIGCDSKKNRSQKETPTLLAYRLIDEQRTDEAIELLERELKKDPDNQQHKSVLASAYAHKAGIKIQKLVPIITQTERLKKLKDNFVELGPTISTSERMNASAINISIYFIKLSAIVDTYAAVPILTTNEAVYLKHSIGLLNSQGKQLSVDDVLYRVVLEVILFKHIFTENLIGEFVATPSASESSAPIPSTSTKCRVAIGHLNDTFITLGKLLIDIFNDLSIARPDQAAEMRKLSQATGEAVSNLTLATTSMVVLDEASAILLKQALFQKGLGKVIQCD